MTMNVYHTSSPIEYKRLSFSLIARYQLQNQTLTDYIYFRQRVITIIPVAVVCMYIRNLQLLQGELPSESNVHLVDVCG